MPTHSAGETVVRRVAGPRVNPTLKAEVWMDLCDNPSEFIVLQFSIDSFSSRNPGSGFLHSKGDLLHNQLTFVANCKSISCVFSEDWRWATCLPVYIPHVATDVQANQL